MWGCGIVEMEMGVQDASGGEREGWCASLVVVMPLRFCEALRALLCCAVLCF